MAKLFAGVGTSHVPGIGAAVDHKKTQEPSPYILVRKNLEALISRNVFYQLVEEAKLNSETQELEINSGGDIFALGKVI